MKTDYVNLLYYFFRIYFRIYGTLFHHIVIDKYHKRICISYFLQCFELIKYLDKIRKGWIISLDSEKMDSITDFVIFQ